MAVYESHYSKAVLHRDSLKQQIGDKTEHMRTLTEELGETLAINEEVSSQHSLSMLLNAINERVDSMERISILLKLKQFVQLFYLLSFLFFLLVCYL